MSEELRLDRKRSYGTVYNHPGIGYMQDNIPFRHDGTPYVEPPPEVTFAGAPVPKVEDMPTAEQIKMRQVLAARRAEVNAAKS